MAAFDYAIPKATADRLLARFGQQGTLRRPTTSGTAYNPTQGAPVDHAAIFAVLDFDNREVDGSRVLAADKKVLLAKGALAIEPATSDLLLIGGVPHSIIRVQPLAPGGTVILYEIQARR